MADEHETDETDEVAVIHFTVVEGTLVLTVPPEHVVVCVDCPNLHVRVGPASREHIVSLAAGLLHLAGHVPETPE